MGQELGVTFCTSTPILIRFWRSSIYITLPIYQVLWLAPYVLQPSSEFKYSISFNKKKKEYKYLFIFREKGKEGEREGEKHQRIVPSRMPPTGDLVHNPGMCPDWESKKRPFGSQAGTQPTEPHQPGWEKENIFDTRYFITFRCAT